MHEQTTNMWSSGEREKEGERGRERERGGGREARLMFRPVVNQTDTLS